MHSKSVNCKNTKHQSLFALPVTYISVTDGAAYKKIKKMVIKIIAISTFQYIILYIIGNNDSRKVLDFLIRNASKKKLTDFFFFLQEMGLSLILNMLKQSSSTLSVALKLIRYNISS